MHSRIARRLAGAVGLAGALLVSLNATALADVGDVTGFALPQGVQPGYGQITLGPDGRAWFNNFYFDTGLGRMTVGGDYSQLSLDSVLGVTTGPDGNIWATGSGAILRITPEDQVTSWALPCETFVCHQAWSITTGQDGRLWFTEPANDRVGAITTDGAITEWLVGAHLQAPLALGPDGNIWFSRRENPTNLVSKISPSGGVTDYPVPVSFTEGIAAGPDGAVWVASHSFRSIFRVDPQDGGYTEFRITGAAAGITVGADGNLWYAEPGIHAISRMTTSGQVTDFPLPDQNEYPFAMAPGDGCTVWYTSHGLDGSRGQVGFIQVC